ncbi:unnamed protein product, partial [Ectocarpus sp. 8 AP-2014]
RCKAGAASHSEEADTDGIKQQRGGGTSALASRTPSTMASTDRDVLVALYNATEGANWENSTNWITGAELSQWYGVTVNDQGRVVQLALHRNNLRGPIPVELGRLAVLEHLSLGRNELTGPIPSELGHLSALKELYLMNNELS